MRRRRAIRFTMSGHALSKLIGRGTDAAERRLLPRGANGARAYGVGGYMPS